MSEDVDYHEVRPITVWIDEVEQRGSLELSSTTDSHWTLVLTAPDGRTWSGAGQGLWTAFVELWSRLEPHGYKLCCAGARTDAWMRHGRSVDGDLVDLWTRRTFFGIRHRAWLFDYAPPSEISTIAAQEARYSRWIDTPWWRALLPGDPVR